MFQYLKKIIRNFEEEMCKSSMVASSSIINLPFLYQHVLLSTLLHFPGKEINTICKEIYYIFLNIILHILFLNNDTKDKLFWEIFSFSFNYYFFFLFQWQHFISSSDFSFV